MADLALVGAAALMGLVGLPHCAAMCAAPCAAVTRGAVPQQALFQGMRVLGYTAAGALAAASVGALRDGLAFAPALRPLWTLLHLFALAVGLWMLARGRWPAWLQRRPAAPQPEKGWQRIAGPARAACAGAAWIAWPCALSQSALLVAALGDTPAVGAGAMAAFALASAPGLWIGPLVLARISAGASATQAVWPLRAAGLLLAATGWRHARWPGA